MKAARVHAIHEDYRIVEVPVPEPRPFELLIKTGAAGYCHSDYMVQQGEYGDLSPFPITGSHEAVGTVVQMGSEVTASGKFKKGDRVGAYLFVNFCGKCMDCRTGNGQYCDLKELNGISRDGAFAEYSVVDYRCAVLLPDTMSFEKAAPLMCAGLTSYSALKKMNLPKGSFIGIIGLGGLGHLAVQFARIMGYKVFGLDSRQEPLDLACQLPFPPTIAFRSADGVDKALEQIRRVAPESPWEGLDGVLVVTDAPPAFQFAVKILRKHGSFCLIGQPAAGVTFDFKDFVFKDIKVFGSIMGTQEDLEELVHVVTENGVSIHTEAYTLDKINTLVADAHKPGTKGKKVVLME